MTLDWTALVVAIIALVGTIYTVQASKRRSRRPSPVEDAAVVSGIITEQMKRMADELTDVEVEVRGLKAENRKLRSRISLLEHEVIRLGGDPILVLGNGT